MLAIYHTAHSKVHMGSPSKCTVVCYIRLQEVISQDRQNSLDVLWLISAIAHNH